MKKVILFLGLFLGLFLLFASSCGKKSSVIVYVLPEGYSGVFFVYEDKKNGQSGVVDGENLIFYLNKDNNLSMKDIGVLNSWHKVMARYDKSGKIYLTDENGEGMKFFGLKFTNGRMYYLIGTDDEYDRLMKEFDLPRFLSDAN